MTKKKLEKISYLAAETLIDIGAVNFSPKKKFKLTSGKFSPVYCDCRKIISFPKERKRLMEFALNIIKDKSFFKKITNISGGETAGIPFSSFLSSKLNLPMTYIRKEKKKFGKKSQIEGIMTKNDHVILVEDLITDGGSKLEFLRAIENSGAKIEAIFVIFNYGIFQDFFNYKKKKINLISLTNWKCILEVVENKKILTSDELSIVKNFLETLNIKN